MYVWIEQWYVYVPGAVGKVRTYVPPFGPIFPLLIKGKVALSEVTVCVTPSLFVHVTVTPALPGNVTELGEKAYPDIETAAVLPPLYPDPMTVVPMLPYMLPDIWHPQRAVIAMIRMTMFRMLIKASLPH